MFEEVELHSCRCLYGIFCSLESLLKINAKSVEIFLIDENYWCIELVNVLVNLVRINDSNTVDDKNFGSVNFPSDIQHVRVQDL